MTPRLCTPAELTAGVTIELDTASGHHAVRVLRLNAGAPVELFDGAGHAALASIVSTNPCTVLVERLLMSSPAPLLRLTLAQCISAADKMDWTIEKAVELGAAAIVPLQSESGIVKLSPERGAKRRAHWQRLILAASAQSRQNRLPRLDEVMKLEDWLRQPIPDQVRDQDDNRVLRLILHPCASESLSALLTEHEPSARPSEGGLAPARPRDIWLLCGPESGFSDAEFSQACTAGWTPVRLGPRVLRTETAGLAALAILQARWGDLL